MHLFQFHPNNLFENCYSLFIKYINNIHTEHCNRLCNKLCFDGFLKIALRTKLKTTINAWNCVCAFFSAVYSSTLYFWMPILVFDMQLVFYDKTLITTHFNLYKHTAQPASNAGYFIPNKQKTPKIILISITHSIRTLAC